MKKKVLLAMCMMLVMMSLAGCGEEPVTAESLIENMQAGSYASCDMDMIMDIKMSTSMDYGEMGSLSMDVEMLMDTNMKCDEDTCETSGKMTMSMLGMSYSVPVENYVQVNEESVISYSKIADDEQWYWSEENSEEYENLLANMEMLNGVEIALIQNLELIEPTEEAPEYIVTGTLAYKDIIEHLGTDMGELMESMGAASEDLADYYENLVCDVTYTFDEETKLVKHAKVVMNTDALESQEGVTFEEFTVECIYNQWGDIAVEVPADVVENAIEMPITGE